MKLSILMPVYNEEERIADALKQALAVDYPCEIELVVVNDGSRDGTAEILDGADDPRLRVIHHPRNAGKGAAIKTAVDSANGDYMVILDADLEYDPQDIPKLLDPVLDGRAKVVYGNRTFGSHSAFSFWYVMGNKAVTTVRQRAVQLLHRRPGDLLQADAGRAVPVARRQVARVRHGGRGHRQAAAPARSGPTRCRSATTPAAAKRARRSPGRTASRRWSSWAASGPASGPPARSAKRSETPRPTGVRRPRPARANARGRAGCRTAAGPRARRPGAAPGARCRSVPRPRSRRTCP